MDIQKSLIELTTVEPKLTQKQIAAALGCTQPHISAMLRGESLNPSYKIVCALGALMSKRSSQFERASAQSVEAPTAASI